MFAYPYKERYKKQNKKEKMGTQGKSILIADKDSVPSRSLSYRRILQVIDST